LTALGVLGELKRWPIVLVALLLLLATQRVWVPWIRRIPRLDAPASLELRGATVITALAIGAVVLLLVTLSLYPPCKGDDITYHLPVAALFARTGQIQPTLWLRFGALPHGAEMLFSSMLLFGDDLDAQLVQLLMLVLLTLALYADGARTASARAGLWAAALWLGSPLVLWLGSACYVDMSVTLFTTMATIALLIWRERRGAWLSVSAAMAGFAASTKYQGLWIVLLIGIVLLVFERRPRCAIRFVAIATVIALPWYLIDSVIAGDPLYPLGGALFGYKWWSAEDLKVHVGWWHTIGRGRSIGALLQLPINLIRFPDAFRAEAHVSPAYLLGFPAIAIALIRDTRLRRLTALIVAYTLMWFWSAQLVRFLLPAMALLALATALATDRWLRQMPWQRALTVGVTLALLAPGVWGTVDAIRGQSWPPVTPAARESFLARTLPPYQAISFLNRTRGESYRLYAFTPLDGAKYYAQGQILGDWLGPARFETVYEGWPDPKKIREHLLRLNVDLVLGPDQGRDGDLKTSFTRIYKDENAVVYELNKTTDGGTR
jgi:4-amino-4-deoxy-L-arabinose transferase-like glycosyltransferase